MKESISNTRDLFVYLSKYWIKTSEINNNSKQKLAKMDILPSGNIFRELQDIHDTGYFSSQFSIEDQWQQASIHYALDVTF